MSITLGQKNLRAQILQIRDDIKQSNLNKEEVKTSFFNDFPCPLSSEEDIKRVDEYLEEKGNYEKVVRYLSKTVY